MRTRIKICGLTRESDLDAAVEAGVDAVGFVFYGASPRAVSMDRARILARRLPAWVASVGLFVNASKDEVLRTAETVGLSHLQLHGDETPSDCTGLGRPVIKAIRVRATTDAQSVDREAKRLRALMTDFSNCQAVLLDADSAGFGGSGQVRPGRPAGPGRTNRPVTERAARWSGAGWGCAVRPARPIPGPGDAVPVR